MVLQVFHYSGQARPGRPYGGGPVVFEIWDACYLLSVTVFCATYARWTEEDHVESATEKGELSMNNPQDYVRGKRARVLYCSAVVVGTKYSMYAVRYEHVGGEFEQDVRKNQNGFFQIRSSAACLFSAAFPRLWPCKAGRFGQSIWSKYWIRMSREQHAVS